MCGYFALDKFVPSKHLASPAQAPAQIAQAVAPPQSAVTEKSIAVLPFVDMSEKHDQEYFSDGLSEELINQLAQNADLKVIWQLDSRATGLIGVSALGVPTNARLKAGGL